MPLSNELCCSQRQLLPLLSGWLLLAGSLGATQGPVSVTTPGSCPLWEPALDASAGWEKEWPESGAVSSSPGPFCLLWALSQCSGLCISELILPSPLHQLLGITWQRQTLLSVLPWHGTAPFHYGLTQEDSRSVRPWAGVRCVRFLINAVLQCNFAEGCWAHSAIAILRKQPCLNYLSHLAI